MTLSYDAVHQRLAAQRGRASTHVCAGCGERPARDWAWQHTGRPELFSAKDGRPYVEDLSCYLPMCRSCHRFLDQLHNPEYLEWLKTQGSAIARAALSQEVRADVGRRLGEYTTERRKIDPEFRELLRAAASKNIRKALANPGDPEKVSADRAKAARAANSTKRQCECGKIAHAAAIGAHIKASGHKLAEPPVPPPVYPTNWGIS